MLFLRGPPQTPRDRTTLDGHLWRDKPSDSSQRTVKRTFFIVGRKRLDPVAGLSHKIVSGKMRSPILFPGLAVIPGPDRSFRRRPEDSGIGGGLQCHGKERSDETRHAHLRSSWRRRDPPFPHHYGLFQHLQEEDLVAAGTRSRDVHSRPVSTLRRL